MKKSKKWPALCLLCVLFTVSCNRGMVKNEEMWPKEIHYSYLASARIHRIMSHQPAKTKIAMLGNSITELGGDWNHWLDRDDVLNCGQGGYTTQQFTWLLDSCVIASKPDYCFIMGGINDISLGIPVSRIFSNYKYLISRLTKSHIRVIVQSTLYQANNPENNAKVRELNGLLIAWCDKRRIPFIDLNMEMSGENGLNAELTVDGTHLTDSGYVVWSGILKKFIKKSFI